MKESSGNVIAVVLAGTMALASLALIDLSPEADAEDEMSFWEAYARGLVSVTMTEKTYPRGEDTVTLPVGIRVASTAGVPIVLGEEAMLMSPHPSEPPQAGAPTTQDAVLPPGTIPAGGSLTYDYGEEVLRGFLPGPSWWCSEEFQFTRADVTLEAGGEILPFALRPMLRSPYYDGPEANTQADLWAYLRSYAAVIVGKTPLWTSIDVAAGQRIEVAIRATNLAVYAFGDASVADVNVTGGAIEDDVPAGWVVEEGSYSSVPDEILEHEDGSRTLRWSVDLPAALESETESPEAPTPYETVTRSYVLVSPAMPAGRFVLPRARSDMAANGTVDARSAPLLLDVVPSDLPPTADAGGPYEGGEGDTIALTAAGSSDPEGASLEYRWDFTDDGAFETAWSASPEALARYGDDFAGRTRVEVRDGTYVVSAAAPVTVSNVRPEIRDLRAATEAELRLVVAGTPENAVRLRVMSGEDLVAHVRVVRSPADPWEASGTTGRLAMDLSKGLGVAVEYEPEEAAAGRPHGDNPTWIVILLPDGSEVRRFHNFNAIHRATWTWDLGDMREILATTSLTFRADLRDPGADDLEVIWDFGDGSSLREMFANVGGAPSEVTAVAVHAFAESGPHTVTVTVRDDDAGEASATITVDG